MAGCPFSAAISAAFELAKRTAQTPGPVYAGAGRNLLADAPSTQETAKPPNLRATQAT